MLTSIGGALFILLIYRVFEIVVKSLITLCIVYIVYRIIKRSQAKSYNAAYNFWSRVLAVIFTLIFCVYYVFGYHLHTEINHYISKILFEHKMKGMYKIREATYVGDGLIKVVFEVPETGVYKLAYVSRDTNDISHIIRDSGEFASASFNKGTNTIHLSVEKTIINGIKQADLAFTIIPESDTMSLYTWHHNPNYKKTDNGWIVYREGIEYHSPELNDHTCAETIASYSVIPCLPDYKLRVNLE